MKAARACEVVMLRRRRRRLRETVNVRRARGPCILRTFLLDFSAQKLTRTQAVKLAAHVHGFSLGGMTGWAVCVPNIASCVRTRSLYTYITRLVRSVKHAMDRRRRCGTSGGRDLRPNSQAS